MPQVVVLKGSSAGEVQGVKRRKDATGDPASRQCRAAGGGDKDQDDVSGRRGEDRLGMD